LVGEWLQADFLDAHDCFVWALLCWIEGILGGIEEEEKKLRQSCSWEYLSWAVEGDQRGALVERRHCHMEGFLGPIEPIIALF
jgi:hypothetical protein